MRGRHRARELAANLIEVAGLAGVPCRALITDMSQPLARSAGNALEMAETVEFLKGGYRQPRLEDVIMSLGSEMLMLGGLAESPQLARLMLNRVIDTGMAAECFARMLSMQGGPADFIENSAKYLVPAPVIKALAATCDGCIEYMDTRAIGMSIVSLGGGRKKADDKIDHRVGLSDFCLVGATVKKGDPLVTIHAADEAAWQAAAGALTAAIVIGRATAGLPAVYEQFPHVDAGQTPGFSIQSQNKLAGNN
jgi:thymidine phosphorylase